MSNIRSNMSDIPVGEYERIFGKREPVYIDDTIAHAEKIVKDGDVTIISEDGKKQDKLSAAQKNRLYRAAKNIRENLPDTLCTKSECWHPIDKNVKKMLHNEFRNPQVQQYKVAMQAIGADPRDCGTERLRRIR